MAVFDLFSKRQKKLRGDVPDVYVYDALPPPLRVQIVHIMRGAIGGPQVYGDMRHPRHDRVNAAYNLIVEILCREYGTFILPSTEEDRFNERDYLSELTNFLLYEKDAERVLDAIELMCRYIEKSVRE